MSAAAPPAAPLAMALWAAPAERAPGVARGLVGRGSHGGHDSREDSGVDHRGTTGGTTGGTDTDRAVRSAGWLGRPPQSRQPRG